MKRWSVTGGYTLVEVLIVLAISGAMLIAAITLFNGKEARTQFSLAMNDLDSKIQEVINGTASGFIPDNGQPIRCRINGNNLQLQSGNADDIAGTRKDCILVAKLIQFQPPAPDQERVKIFTVVGKRTTDATGAQLVDTLDDADLHIVAPTGPSLPDMTETYSLKWGMKISKVVETGTATQQHAVGFFNSFGPDTSGTNPVSGSTNMFASTVPIGANANYNVVSANIRTMTDTSVTFPANGVTICLDGNNGQYGRLVIGGNNSDLSTHVIHDDRQKAAIC